MALQEVGQFSLIQDGGYVARTEFQFIDPNTGHTGMSQQTNNELNPGTYITDPGPLGVPDGAIVTFYLWVMAGYDQLANESFIYKRGSTNTAQYRCKGVTITRDKLEFLGVK